MMLLRNAKSKSVPGDAQCMFKEADVYLYPVGLCACAIIPPGIRLLLV